MYLFLSVMVLLILWNLDMLNLLFKTGFFVHFLFVGHGDCIERQMCVYT